MGWELKLTHFILHAVRNLEERIGKTKGSSIPWYCEILKKGKKCPKFSVYTLVCTIFTIRLGYWSISDTLSVLSLFRYQRTTGDYVTECEWR